MVTVHQGDLEFFGEERISQIAWWRYKFLQGVLGSLVVTKTFLEVKLVDLEFQSCFQVMFKKCQIAPFTSIFCWLQTSNQDAIWPKKSLGWQGLQMHGNSVQIFRSCCSFGMKVKRLFRQFPQQPWKLIPHSIHFTLATLHFTLHTLHFTLRTLHFTLHTLCFISHTLHSTLYTPHFTLYTPHFTLYTPHLTLYTPNFTLYTPPTLYTLHFALHICYSTLYTLHCTIYTPFFFSHNYDSGVRYPTCGHWGGLHLVFALATWCHLVSKSLSVANLCLLTSRAVPTRTRDRSGILLYSISSTRSTVIHIYISLSKTWVMLSPVENCPGKTIWDHPRCGALDR